MYVPSYACRFGEFKPVPSLPVVLVPVGEPK